MELIDFEDQCGPNSIHFTVDVTDYIYDKDDEKVKIFNRMVDRSMLKTYNTKNTSSLVVDCDVLVPSWFYTAVNKKIATYIIGPKYPRHGIAKIANIIKGNLQILQIILDPDEDTVVDFEGCYTPETLELLCPDKAKVKLMNAPCIKRLHIVGNISIKIEKLIKLRIIHALSGQPSVKCIGDTCRKITRLTGEFSKLIVKHSNKIQYDVRSIPKNKLKTNIGRIINNMPYLVDNPKYESLLGYQNIHICCGRNDIDLSSFKIDELNALFIDGELGSGRLALPEIRNIKKLTIKCCRIKNTYFDRVQNIGSIEVMYPYAIQDYGNGKVYEYTQDYCEMLATIDNIFDNIIRFGNINCYNYTLLSLKYNNLFDGSVLTQEKYEEFMSKKYGKTIVKSARK